MVASDGRSLRMVAGLLFGLVLLASGCAGGGTDAVPEGWRVESGDRWEVAVPADWTREEYDGRTILVGPGGEEIGRMMLLADESSGAPADDILSVLLAGMVVQFADIDRVGDRIDWSPPGADSAALQEVVYEEELDGVPVDIRELAGTIVGDRSEMVVRISDREARFDESRPLLEQILDTVVVDP